MSSCSNEQNVLYKLFVRTVLNSKAPLNHRNLSDMFSVIAEPFKVYVEPNNNWALAYFGTRQDARACMAAFHEQPPYFYQVTQSRDDIHVMNPKEIARMNGIIQNQAKKLKQIDAKMQELKVERMRLISRISGNYVANDSEFGLSSEEDEVSSLAQSRSISGSRQSLASTHPARSKSRSRNNTYQSGEYRQGPFEDAQKAFNDSVPGREYNNVQHNRPPRNSMDQNRNSFRNEERRSRTPARQAPFEDAQKAFNDSGTGREFNDVQHNRPSRNSMDQNRNSFRNQERRSRTPARRESNDDWGQSQNGGLNHNFRKPNNSYRGSNSPDASSKIWTDKPSPILKNSNIPKTNEFAQTNGERNHDFGQKSVPKAQPVEQPILNVKGVTPMIGSRKSIVELLKPGQRGKLTFSQLGENSFLAQLDVIGDFPEETDTLEELEKFYSEDNAIMPKIGEFVCVKDGDEAWRRGYILKQMKLGWRVALIDLGTLTRTDKPCKILPEHENLPEFACNCKIEKKIIDDSDNFCELGKTFGFTVKSVEGRSILCLLTDRKNKQDLCEIRLSRWIPEESITATPIVNTIKNRKIPVAEIRTGSTVIIAFVKTQNNIFVKTRETGPLLLKITEALEGGDKFAAVTGPVEIGDCIAAKYSEDGKWYRAVITSLSADKAGALVTYVDYGNNEKIAIKDAKELPKEVLDIPRALVNIELKDVPEARLTHDQAKYFEQCSEKKIKYLMEYDNFESGVILISTTTQELLNEEILKIKQPKKIPAEIIKSELVEPKKEVVPVKYQPVEIKDEKKDLVSEKNVHPEESAPEDVNTDIPIKYVELPLGKTQLIFQNVLDADDRMIVCYKHDLDALEHVQVELTQQMEEYVTNSGEGNFNPREGSPCLALFEGAWYRALCLVADNDEPTVMFVDFGNYETVPVKNIRKLPKKFATHPAVALVCTVTDVPKEINFSSYFEELNTYDAEVIQKEDEGQYTIKMAHVGAD